MRDRVRTIVYMVIVTAVATALMTGAKFLVEDRIRTNERLFQNRAELYGLGVIPLTERLHPAEVERLHEARVKRAEEDSQVWLDAYDEEGVAPTAVGIEFRGQGFWGPIQGILSADPSGEKIVGLYISSHQETPGLGGRIAEQEFLSQFKERPIPEADPEGAYRLWQPTDAITGATRTSESMERILNKATADLMQRMGEEQ